MTEHPSQRGFRHFTIRISDAMGTPWAFGVAAGTIVLWGVSGPLFHFSDTWQLVINTATTVVTFLMAFVIQTTQNRDAKAIHLKLDELIRANTAARNLFADLEDATEDELKALQAEFKRLRERGLSHSEAASQARERVRRNSRRDDA